MTSRHDTIATLAWMHEGTANFMRCTEKLGDGAIAAPSGLPGWTRAHVLGHVARNAEALTRLVNWARTGVESPMYADRAQRAAEIEQSAAHPPARLRTELVSTAETLAAALDSLTREQWTAPVRSALGRAIPAAEIPWMRIREVWLHAIDLGAGMSFGDLPAGVIDLLLDDVTAALSPKDGCPAVVLAPADRIATWRLGPVSSGRTIAASAADIAGWLTGRVRPADWPALPTWL